MPPLASNTNLPLPDANAWVVTEGATDETTNENEVAAALYVLIN